MLQAESYEDEEGSLPYTVTDDSIINRGMVAVYDTGSEDEIRKKIVNASKQLPLLTKNDFDFVKVNRKTVHSYNLTVMAFPIKSCFSSAAQIIWRLLCYSVLKKPLIRMVSCGHLE